MFVLLEHDAPGGRHWDLMIELSGRSKLATWRLASNPLTAGGAPVAVEPIGDHRREYLDYEGVVSQGRGSVRRLDRGQCRVVEAAEAFVVLQLDGQRLAGRYRLSRLTALDGLRRIPEPPAVDR